MELREWLIILGLGLVTIIVLDGVRRFQRQRNVPRLDQMGAESRDAADNAGDDDYDASVDWELPNGGARVLRPAQYDGVSSKPKLERQEHPGPSRVLSEFRQRQQDPLESVAQPMARADAAVSQGRPFHDLGSNEASGDSLADIDTGSDTATAAPGFEVEDVEQSERLEAKCAEDEIKPVADAAKAESQVELQAEFQEESIKVEEAAVLSDEPAGRREPVLELPGDEAQAQTSDRPVSNQADSKTVEPNNNAAASKAHATANATPAELETHDSLHADPEDHAAYDEEDYRLVDLEGMGHSLKASSRRMGTSVHRFGTSLQRSMSERRQQKRIERKQRQVEKEEKARLKAEQRAAEQERRRQEDEARAARDAERREQEAEARAKREEKLAALRASQASEKAEAEHLEERERAQRLASKAEHESALSESLQAEYEALYGAADEDHARDDSTDQNAVFAAEQAARRDEAPRHPVLEKALRTATESEHAREALSEAGEVIIISVMSRDEAGFSGPTLLKLMLACGLRYASDMGIFHRFETEDPNSSLQFSMVNAVKPGTFPVREMGDFRTPGITLLMPLPGAEDSAAAFEAMVETAMVIVRHLGGELKDENQSVMTAQTVEFARQRVQEFERRHRLRRYQVN